MKPRMNARHNLAPLLILSVLAWGGCKPSPHETGQSSTGGKAAGTPPAAAPNDPVQSASAAGPRSGEERVADIWEASFIGAVKVGHNHTQVYASEVDGKPLRRTTSEQVLRLSRGGDVAEQRLFLESLEEAEGSVLSMSSEMTSQDVTIRTEAKVEGDVLRLSLATAGQTPQVITLAWPRDTLGYFGLYQSLAAQPLKPGESRELRAFMPAVNQIASMKLTAREKKEEVTLLDGVQQTLPIDAVLSLGDTQLRQTIWMDEEGQVVSSFDPQVQLYTFQTSRERALAKSDGVFQFDDTVFIKATGKSLDSPHQRQRAVYRVTVKGEDPARLFPDSDTQRVRSLGPNQAELVIVKARGPAPTVSDAVQDGDVKPNALIQSGDPKIRQMANLVAEGESDPLIIAAALEQLVHEKMERKDYTRAFDSAADVARKLQGDCTEHSVLLAALCRARGIPARVVSGLVAFRDGFAYHMWTEVWTGAAWLPLDATLGRGGIGVGHIKLVHSNLAGANAFAALLPVLQVIGRLEIHVQDLQ